MIVLDGPFHKTYKREILVDLYTGKLSFFFKLHSRLKAVLFYLESSIHMDIFNMSGIHKKMTIIQSIFSVFFSGRGKFHEYFFLTSFVI